jgi:hypothetical protein
MDDPLNSGYHNDWFTNVAVPMWQAHQSYCKENHNEALNYIDACKAPDWRNAATYWLTGERNE